MKTRKPKSASRQAPRTITGVVWLTPRQWQCLRQIAHDPEQLGQDYETWSDRVETHLQQIRQTGVPVEKVEVDPDELATWCRDNLRPIDSAARAKFVALKVRQKYSREAGPNKVEEAP